MWRGGMSPIGSGSRTRPVKAVVVGWATAESPAAGCGAGREDLRRRQMWSDLDLAQYGLRLKALPAMPWKMVGSTQVA